MARATRESDENQFVKLLLIGDTKTGKTHWTMEAAEDGFNLVYLDGDVGAQTIKRRKPDGTYFFSEEARSRVYHFFMGDTITKARYSNNFLDLVNAKPSIYWSDTLNRRVRKNVDDLENDEISEISLTKLGANDVLVIDSWTALSHSEMETVADRTNTDLGEMEKADRGIYASSGNRLTQFLRCIQHIKCHVIVIAHPDEYMHYKKPKGKQGRESELELIKQMMIPKSSSKPHGLTLGKYFSDVLWMEVDGAGRRFINGRPSPDKIVGSRFDSRKPSSEYSFKQLVLQAGGKSPDKNAECAGVVEHPVGSLASATTETPKKKVLGGGSNNKPVGLGGLMKK